MGHQNFVSPDPAFLKTQVEHTKKCIEIAFALGALALGVTGYFGWAKVVAKWPFAEAEE